MTPLQQHPVHLLLIASHFIYYSQEPGVRLFFRPFLIVHLAPNTDMDDYLGFTPIKPYALL
ncbi:MAG: hypothetical protein WAL98_14340 [Desulfatiglandaceae bacterium]